MPLPFTTYAIEELCTSWEELINLFSEMGVDQHIDHVPEASLSDYKLTMITRATREVAMYLSHRFVLEDLALDPKIREIATYILAYRISHQRGNTDLFEGHYTESLEMLERFREGTLYLGLPTTHRAVMQSGYVDNRSMGYKILPVGLGSSSTYPNQRLARIRSPFYWMWV